MTRRLLGMLVLLPAAANACLPAPRSVALACPSALGGVIVKLVRSGGAARRPMAPVLIEVAPGAVTGPGRQRLRVTVTPLLDGARVDVKAQAIEGLAIEAGQGQWSVPARAHQPVSAELDLAVSGPGERDLVVTATLVAEDGRRATGAAVYTLNPQPPSRLPRQLRGARTVTGHGGRKILELPSQPQPDAPGRTAEPVVGDPW